MNISELSIRRPVLATVLTIIILLFGFIGYNYLGAWNDLFSDRKIQNAAYWKIANIPAFHDQVL